MLSASMRVTFFTSEYVNTSRSVHVVGSMRIQFRSAKRYMRFWSQSSSAAEVEWESSSNSNSNSGSGSSHWKIRLQYPVVRLATTSGAREYETRTVRADAFDVGGTLELLGDLRADHQSGRIRRGHRRFGRTLESTQLERFRCEAGTVPFGSRRRGRNERAESPLTTRSNRGTDAITDTA